MAKADTCMVATKTNALRFLPVTQFDSKLQLKTPIDSSLAQYNRKLKLSLRVYPLHNRAFQIKRCFSDTKTMKLVTYQASWILQKNFKITSKSAQKSGISFKKHWESHVLSVSTLLHSFCQMFQSMKLPLSKTATLFNTTWAH